MKVWALVVLVGLVIGGFKWYDSARFDAGWNAHAVAYAEELQGVKDAAVETARRQWENTHDIGVAEIIVEEKIVEVIRVVEKEIPKVVERIVTVAPECNDLGAEFAGLLNAQVNSRPVPSTNGAEAATDFDP